MDLFATLFSIASKTTESESETPTTVDAEWGSGGGYPGCIDAWMAFLSVPR
jgi:hypothetical protein